MNKPASAKKVKNQRQKNTHSQRLAHKEEILDSLQKDTFQIDESNRKEILSSISGLCNILETSRARLNRPGTYVPCEIDKFLLLKVYDFSVGLEKIYLEKL